MKEEGKMMGRKGRKKLSLKEMKTVFPGHIVSRLETRDLNISMSVHKAHFCSQLSITTRNCCQIMEHYSKLFAMKRKE